MVIVPLTVAASAGLVRPVVGGVVSGGGVLSTVTLTAAAVPVLPAASNAWAVRLCAPSAAVVVSHDVLYGAVESVRDFGQATET